MGCWISALALGIRTAGPQGVQALSRSCGDRPGLAVLAQLWCVAALWIHPCGAVDHADRHGACTHRNRIWAWCTAQEAIGVPPRIESVSRAAPGPPHSRRLSAKLKLHANPCAPGLPVRPSPTYWTPEVSSPSKHSFKGLAPLLKRRSRPFHR